MKRISKLFNIGRSGSTPEAVAGEYLDRVTRAFNAREHLVNDFFGGWELEDVDLLNRHRCVNAPSAATGEIVDWLGIKTDKKLHAWMGKPNEPVEILDLPIPDDMVHAETIEYVALVTAIERAAKISRKSFTCIEIGASYAPWAIASAVLALRNDFRSVALVALEANSNSLPNITDHARRNGLVDHDMVNIEVVHGAIYVEDGTVQFPDIDTAVDNGAQLTLQPEGIDYRGVPVNYKQVPCYSLDTICESVDYVDFMHMDVQGTERLLLADESFLTTLTSKVSTLFLATQTRGIEGQALEALHGQGWSLLKERPTVYKPNSQAKNIEGWTLRDGGQLWINEHMKEGSQ